MVISAARGCPEHQIAVRPCKQALRYTMTAKLALEDAAEVYQGLSCREFRRATLFSLLDSDERSIVGTLEQVTGARGQFESERMVL